MGFVSSTELVLALLSIVFYKFAAWLWRIKTSGLPPGPAPLPLIGNMLHVFRGGMNNVHITLAKLAEDYGEMFTFYLGSRPMVVLNTYDVMRDAFITHGRSFSGRNQSAVMKVVGKRGGIANAEGNLWKQHRKFAQFHLNQLGFGKSSFESKIHEEVSCLLRALEEKQGEPFDMQVLMSNAVANVVLSISMGKRYDYKDEQFQNYIGMVNENLIAVKRAFLLTDLFPFTRHLPGDFLGFEKIRKNAQVRNDFLQTIIDEHKKTLEPDNIRDYIDAYLVRMIADEEAGISDTTFKEPQLRQVLMDFFVAGMESTANTLRWALLFLCQHPEVLLKVNNEIDDNVSRDTLPSTRDRSKMPYLEAVMSEVFRVGNVSAFGILRATTEDVNFRGYTIPAGTTIFPNTTSIKLDEKLFKDPEEFRPERFINDEGAYEQADYLVPFGMGRRSCLGEPLARMEYYLFLSALLQRFTFSLPDPLPSSMGILGITHGPRPYRICAHPRS